MPTVKYITTQRRPLALSGRTATWRGRSGAINTVHLCGPTQVGGDQGELVQRGLQVFDDLGGDHVGRWQIGRVFQAVVFEPEDVEAGLVPLHQFVIGEGMEPLRLFSLVSVLGLVAGDEVVQVFAGSGFVFSVKCSLVRKS